MASVLGPFSDDGRRLVVVFPVSVKDPDEAMRRVCQKAYGSNYQVLIPREEPDAYEAAYDVITKNLDEGESFSVLDRASGKSTFYTPTKEVKAWSGWVRVVDISKFFLN